MTHVLTSYPFATFSAGAFYLALAICCIPSIRHRLVPLPEYNVGHKNAHLAGFDTYRGLAALFVATAHMWYFSYPVFAETQLKANWLEFGSAAVPVFCILSGFLIYRSVEAIKDIDGLRSYVLRRIFRIYPVYLVGVFLCLLFGLYGSSRAFFADVFMLRVLWWPSFGNPVTWSLYHEILFYMMLPLIVAVVGTNRMGLFGIMALIALTLADVSSADFGLYKYFVIGILASVAVERVRPVAIPIFIVGLGLLLFDLSGPSQPIPNAPNRWPTDWANWIGIAVERWDRETLGLGIGFGLVLSATPGLPRIGRILEVWPMRLLGLVSYSLFILHPFYILLNFPEMGRIQPNFELFKGYDRMSWWYLPLIFAPGAIFWAIVSYIVIERPGIALGKRLAGRQPSPAGSGQPRT